MEKEEMKTSEVPESENEWGEKLRRGNGRRKMVEDGTMRVRAQTSNHRMRHDENQEPDSNLHKHPKSQESRNKATVLTGRN
ncbi:hypothetical protein KM043_003456 [Ampulex compressa]|nr:hypothetical protein KM043_003456 [Ampulex compressa]